MKPPTIAELAPLLEQAYGVPPSRPRLHALQRHASSRRYFRLQIEEPPADGPSSLVVMQLPPDASSDEAAQRVATGSELPFLQIQRLLHDRGVRVPAVRATTPDRTLILLEDLGNETLEDRLAELPQSQWSALYAEAVDLLARMHARCEQPDPHCVAYQRELDQALARWELDHFRRWGLEEVHGALSPSERETLDWLFDRLASEMAAIPSGFVHRDFQSRNLMWVGTSEDSANFAVIDFQDALQGPSPYDLVALLCDSYVPLDYELQQQMIARYLHSRGRHSEGEIAREFERAFWLVALQRKLKDAGRFVYIDRQRHNSSFLQWYAPSLVYVARALRELSDWGSLAELLERRIPGFPDEVANPPSVG